MYRWALDKDKPAVMALWAKGFEHYEPYYSWYFSTVYRPELTLCDFKGLHLAAMLQISPYTLQLRGAALKVAYLVGVITDPDFRGQGRGHALLQEALGFLAQQGYAAALLYTDIPAFYAPLGYRHCYTRQQLSLPAGMFPLLTAQPHSKIAWRAGSLRDDISVLSDIYTGMTESYHGYIRRTAKDWKKYLGEHHCDKALLSLAESRAYLLYTVDDEKLHVIELGFACADTLAEALAKAACLAAAAGVTCITWPAPPDAPQLLPHIPADFWQRRPFVMARLINWLSATEALACPESVLPILARLDTATRTQLIFGVAGSLEGCSELTPPEQRYLTELFPPLPLWVNEYT